MHCTQNYFFVKGTLGLLLGSHVFKEAVSLLLACNGRSFEPGSGFVVDPPGVFFVG